MRVWGVGRWHAGRTDRKVAIRAESSHSLRKFRELNPKLGEGAAGVVVPSGCGCRDGAVSTSWGTPAQLHLVC